MLGDIRHRRNMRRDNDAFVVPQPLIRWAFEFSVVDIQADATKLALGQSITQSRLVDDLAARDID